MLGRLFREEAVLIGMGLQPDPPASAHRQTCPCRHPELLSLLPEEIPPFSAIRAQRHNVMLVHLIQHQVGQTKE